MGSDDLDTVLSSVRERIARHLGKGVLEQRQLQVAIGMDAVLGG
jgi:hypothetical protein